MPCLIEPLVRKVLIKCPASFRTALNCPDEWFESFDGNNHLRISVNPAQYTQSYEGNKPTYTRFLRGARLEVAKRTLVIVVDVPESDVRVRLLLQKISQNSLTSGYNNHIPVQMVDYANFGYDGYAALVAETESIPQTTFDPYIVRTGYLYVEPGNGFIGRTPGNIYTVNSLRFSFEQIKQEVI